MFHKRVVFLWKRKFALLLLCILIFLVPVRVSFALEPSAATDSNAGKQDLQGKLPETNASSSDAEPETPIEPEAPVEPETPVEPEAPIEPEMLFEALVVPDDTVDSFSALTEWLADHAKKGGTVQLENDIYMPAGERYKYSGGWLGDPTLYINVGEYTIYVSGHLELNPHLSFFGTGGDDGIFHVEQGGYLDLSSIAGDSFEDSFVSVSAKEGYAVYQEEGAFFGCFTDKIKGKIRYPENPVAWPLSDVSEFYGKLHFFPVVVLPQKGEPYEADLPQTISSYLCENGWHDSEEEDLPVVWNFEEFEETLAARERFLITGRYTGGVTALAEPACLVTFLREDGAVFLQCSASKNETEQQLFFEMYVKLDDPSMEHRLEWSEDGDIWQQAKPEDFDEDGFVYTDEYEIMWEEASEGSIKYSGGFYSQDLPRFFSIAVTDSQGHTTYSDTIFLNGDDKIAGWDNGGGRNGEVSPGDPDDGGLPPILVPPEEPAPPGDETLAPEENPDNGNGNAGSGHRPEHEDRNTDWQNTDWQNTELKKPQEEIMEIQAAVDEDVSEQRISDNPSLSAKVPQSNKADDGLWRSAAGFPGAPAAGLPAVPAAGFPGTPPAGLPGTPAAGFPGTPPAGLSGAPSAGAPSAELSGVPADGFSGAPAALSPDAGDGLLHTAAAVAIIALIGTPVYLTPIWKKLWKRIKLRRHQK